MPDQDPKTIVRRFVDEYQTANDLDSFTELMHPDVVDHSRLPGMPEGAAGVRALFDMLRAGLPDLSATILDQACEGDRVWTRKVFRGTHRGELMGAPATGNQVAFDCIDVVRVQDGQIVEHWNVVDQLSLLRALGAIPEPVAT